MSDESAETGLWPEVDDFAALMRRELDANAYKGHWRSIHPGFLLSEVIGHVAKLMDAIDKDNADAILEHAADVANLSMMIADVTAGVPHIGREAQVGGDG